MYMYMYVSGVHDKLQGLKFVRVTVLGQRMPGYVRSYIVYALVPSGVPLLAATATVTRAIREDVIDKLDRRGH